MVSKRAETEPAGATKVITAPLLRAPACEVARTPMAGLGRNVTSARSIVRSVVSLSSPS